MTWPYLARGAAVWLVALALWVYAVLGFVFGLMWLFLFPPLSLPFILGSAVVVAGTIYARRRRAVLAGALIVAGGVIVGGSLGVLAMLWEYEASLESVSAGLAGGILFAGWPPLLAGLGLMGWGIWGQGAAERQPTG